MGTRLVVVFALVCAFMLGAIVAQGSARIDASVRCAHPAEDTLAHVRMVALSREHGTYTVVYRCMRNGY